MTTFNADGDYMPDEPHTLESPSNSENVHSINVNRIKESVRSQPRLPHAFELIALEGEKRAVPQLNVPTFIEMVFGCMGLPISLFATEEIEREDPSTLMENISARADDQGLILSPMTPVLASMMRSLHQRRNGKLAALKQQEAKLSSVGLSRLTQDPGTSASFSEFLKMRDRTRKDDLDVMKMTCGNKLKRYDNLRDRFVSYFLQALAPLDPSVILDELGPVMFQWLGTMVQSSFRPARQVGTFLLGCVGVALTARVTSLQADFHSNCEQLDSEKRSAASTSVVNKRTRQIKEQLRAADRLLSLISDVITALKSRVDDVAWHIQYEASYMLGLVAVRVPIWALLSNTRWYVEVLDLIFGHEVVDIRVLAVEQVEPLLTSLQQALTLHWPRDKATNFELDDSLIPDQAVFKLQQRIGTQCPKLPEVSLRLNQLFDTVLQLCVKHVQDPDIRVATISATQLLHISSAEAECKRQWEIGLSDSSITSAVSLLFYTDCPIVRTEVARFVDSALFAHSVIDEEETRQILLGEASPLTPERVQQLSVQLCTLVEFFRDYATGATWVSRHTQAVKSLWPLTPVLHHFDILLGHLGLAFKSAPIGQSAELAQTLGGSALWCDDGSAGAMLSLVLASMECQRTCLGGRSRYCYFTPLVTDTGFTATDAERTLSEISSGGYRLVPDDALWTFRSLELEQRPLAKRIVRNILSLWNSIVPIIHGARSDGGHILVAVSLAFELVDATDAMLAALRMFRGEVDLSELAQHQSRTTATVIGLIRNQRSRQSLKALFAVLMRLRDQSRRLEVAAPEIEGDSAFTEYQTYLLNQEKEVDKLLEDLRKNLLGDISALVKIFTEQRSHTEQNSDQLRGLIHLCTTLAENDVSNTFRHGLETLDDLMTLLEVKSKSLKEERQQEQKSPAPSHALTVLVFDLLWVALARYMEQIAQRTETHLRETIFEPLRKSGTEVPPDFLEPQHAAKVEERIRLFKEDLEIYSELRKQILTFATDCSEGLRGSLPNIRSITEETEYTDHDKESLLLASACVTTIINASYFRTLSPLWTRIARLFRYLLNHPVKVTLTESAIKNCTQILNMADACGNSSEVEVVHEVALLADDLRLRSRDYVKDMEAVGLVSELPFPSLTMGLWPVNNAHPDINPSPYGITNLHHLYRNLKSERAVQEFLQELPSVGELAETFHVQLAAAVCQLPDPTLWRDSSLGLVILHGMSSRSLLSQRIGAAFMERLMLYERLQRQEMIDVKVGEEEQARPLLQELLLATIWAAIMRYRGEEKGVRHAQTIAKNSAIHTGQYFQSLDDQGVDDFVMRVVAYATTPHISLECVIQFMKTVAMHLLGGRLKRRWKKEVAQSRLNAVYQGVLTHCAKWADNDKFLSGLKVLLRCCYFPASGKLLPTAADQE